MIKQLLSAFTLATLLASSSFAFAAKQNFGSGADMNKLEKISEVLSSPDTYLNQTVTVQGTIVSVCSKRGCWMKLASDQRFQTLRIKVRDGDMVFPMSARGKTAFATGKLAAIELSQQQAVRYLAHLAEEAKQAFDPASVTGPMTIYQLVPEGVTISDQ